MPHTSVDFRILGTRALFRDGAPFDATLLAQPKRLGLLTYLAVARAEGRIWVSRDELLALFWPETESGKARKALSQSLWILRQDLGDDALAKRGTSDLSLARSEVETDLERFLAALDQDRPADALNEYRGDLLAGFHLSGSSAFHLWLDTAQARLRARAVEAAWNLAHAEGAAGRRSEGLRWARRAHQVGEVSDEGNLRRLMTYLSEAGDRAGAIAAFEAHREALAEDDDAPLPVTVALAEEIRGPARSPEPNAARRRRPRGEAVAKGYEPMGWVRWALGGVAFAIVLLTAFLSGRASFDPAELSEGRMVILPFEYQGTDARAYLGSAMVDLMALRLDGVADLRAVDPGAVFTALAGRRPSVELTDSLVAGFSAGLRLEGTVIEAGERLEFSARLSDASGRTLARATTNANSEAGVLEAVDRLALELLGERLMDMGEPLASSAALGAGSVAALQAFLRGEAAFRRFDFVAAGDLYQEAVRLDSTFALAHFRRSRVGDWTNQPDLLTGGLAAAQRHRERLPLRTQRLVDGYSEFWQGSIAGGLTILESLVADYPFDAEARFQLADAQFHGFPRLGRPVTESAQSFRTALELNPADTRATLHLLGLEAYLGNVAEARRLAATLGENEGARGFQVMAMSEGPRPVSPSLGLRRALEALPISIMSGAVLTPADFREDPELLETAGTLIHAGTAGPAEQIIGLTLQFLGRMAAGRLEDAFQSAEALERLSPAHGVSARLYLLAAPWTPLPPDDVELPRTHTVEAEILEALVRVRQSRPDQADSVLRHLENEHGPTSEAHSGAVNLVRALIDEARGAPAEGLRRIEALREGGSRLGVYGTDPFLPNALERFHRARLLEVAGRSDEALSWFGTMAAPVSHSLPFAAPAHLARARLLDSLGRADEAVEAYRRAGVIWAHASASFQPQVEGARARAKLPVQPESH